MREVDEIESTFQTLTGCAPGAHFLTSAEKALGSGLTVDIILQCINSEYRIAGYMADVIDDLPDRGAFIAERVLMEMRRQWRRRAKKIRPA